MPDLRDYPAVDLPWGKPQPGEWVQEAACRGMDPAEFYPHRGQMLTSIKHLCADCPVRRECLEHAITTPEPLGLWGGKSERERREIRRQRFASQQIRNRRAS